MWIQVNGRGPGVGHAPPSLLPAPRFPPCVQVVQHSAGPAVGAHGTGVQHGPLHRSAGRGEDFDFSAYLNPTTDVPEEDTSIYASDLLYLCMISYMYICTHLFRRIHIFYMDLLVYSAYDDGTAPPPGS